MYKFIKNAKVSTDVKNASLLLATYAVWVLVGTVWYAVDTDFENTKELIRGLIRFGGVTYVAWWLLTLDKRAWWFAVAASGFFSSMGVLAIAMFIYIGSTYDSIFLVMIVKLLVPLYLLIHALIILCKKETRAQFQSLKTA